MRTIVLALLLLSTGLHAQDPHFERLTYPVNFNGLDLKFPFAGGMNTPQFSAVDLNNDQVLDLVVFDRAGDVVLTFINTGGQGEANYVFVPDYACYFPKLNDYVLLRDYNGDGAADIFCASHQTSAQEVQVYRGYFEDNILKFTPFEFYYPNCPTCDSRFIWYPDEIPGFWNNLVVSRADYPDINDIDGDGDLDILTFEASVGGNVWLFKNTSVENGYGLDSLHFEVVDKCWGRFYESGLENCKCNLSPGPDSCNISFAPVLEERNTRHPGSTVLSYDQDFDGDMDLVLGDISFTCLNFLENCGNSDAAWMCAQDTAFPIYNVPVDLPVFPGGFYFDANNDGKMDLVAAPNNKTIGDDRQCAWLYLNDEENGHNFTLSNKRFLVQDMIDLGSTTHPAFVDVNADGKLDIVVGTFGFYTFANPNNARLYLFLNNGTFNEPSFTLADEDWQGMSEFVPDDYDFAPTFADMDGDLDLDMLVGSNGGGLYYYRNTAGPGNPMQFQRDLNPMWVAMDVGLASTPAVIDLNDDGRKDIVMGERNGNINYFENMGSPTEPMFANSPTIQVLGGVNTTLPLEAVGFSAPVFIEGEDNAIELVAGTQGGHLLSFGDISATGDDFTLLSDMYGNLDVGNRSHPALADIDFDGMLEMVVGNFRGGLSIFRTQLVNCDVTFTSTNTPGDGTATAIKIFPNPSVQNITVQSPSMEGQIQWQLIGLTGQLIQAGTSASSSFQIERRGIPAGMYLVRLIDRSGKTVTGKVVFN